MATVRRYGFPRTRRLLSRRRFEEVRAARVRISLGPLLVYGLPNDLDGPRLGLAVSRRVGSAPVRNRIKRCLREAFRLQQHDLPCGYDLVISVRPHAPLPLAEYQRLLFKAARSIHQKWNRKLTSSPPPDAPASSPED